MSFSLKTQPFPWSSFLLIGVGMLFCITPTRGQNARPVEIHHAIRQDMTTQIELTGTVVARKHAQLSPRTSGLIAEIHVDAGDRVEKGQTLMTLDVKQAELALEKTKAEHRIVLAELQEAERRVQEVQNLVKKGGFSQSEIRQLEAQVTLQHARLQRLDVEIREQEELVARHLLLAPFSGVIENKKAEIGEWVQTGEAVLALVEEANPWLEVQAPQEIYDSLDTVNELSLWVDDQPMGDHQGILEAKVPVIDRKSRTFRLRIQISPDPNSKLKPRVGASGRIRMALKKPQQTLQVHRDGILRHPDGSTSLWVAQEIDGKWQASSKIVKLGESYQQHVEILSGIEEGEKIIVRGNENLRDGMEIAILNAQSASATAP